MRQEKPWQLKMFEKSLKKKQKINALKKHLGSLTGKRCLLVTCGDNNGASNYHLRQLGGAWTWADFEEKCIKEMEELLQEKVHLLDKDACRLPFPDASFDVVVSIDVHEHLADPMPITAEFSRIIRNNGRLIVTTPNGNERKLAVRIKHLIGMTPKEYGHERVGFDIPDLEKILQSCRFRPLGSSSYSKFFTEMVELIINFAYVKVLAKRSRAKVEPGAIAPATRDQLRSVRRSYMFYCMAYPIFWAVSQLDWMLLPVRGYAVIVEASR